MPRIQSFLFTFSTVICLSFDLATTTNYTKLSIGDMLHDVSKDPPPNILIEGDCILYKYPKILDEIKWGYIHIRREGILEACMQNCSLDISESGFPPPNWRSGTEGEGTDCFLKLEDGGGLAIMKGDLTEPILVKRLWENDNITVYNKDKSMGYELYLEDMYEIKVSHLLEYEPDRFSKNPGLVLKKVVWTWFFEKFSVFTSILVTFPNSDLPFKNTYAI
ncbi:hypothetical protein R1flu_027494 [Riccia fluitans]|uniref:Uncharacterized protein n=1 Tax=Riccia fluitans TaxID=41844 RepID=A0ABD1XLY7_9MARC